MSARDTNTATAAARSNQSAGTAVDRSVDEAIAAAAANGADAAVPTISYRQLVGKPAKPGSFRDRFALTETGVKALVSGAIACAIGNFSLMLPMGVIYLAVIHYVGHLDDPSAPLPEFWPFVAMSVTVLVVMFLAQWWQYDSTYNEIYGESARTRLALAEKLRMLPMSFFSRRSIADLTTAVLADCASLELLFSHVMPELFGATISTTVVAVVMFVYDWRMALAMVWVLPIAVILLLLSRKLQQSLTRAFTKARLSVASGIQESLECAAQLRASGQTDRYLDGLDRRIDAAERAQIRSELIPGTIVSGAQILLTVGKASIILVGAQLVAAGETDFVTYVMFLLCAALIYASNRSPSSWVWARTPPACAKSTANRRSRALNASSRMATTSLSSTSRSPMRAMRMVRARSARTPPVQAATRRPCCPTCRSPPVRARSPRSSAPPAAASPR